QESGVADPRNPGMDNARFRVRGPGGSGGQAGAEEGDGALPGQVGGGGIVLGSIVLEEPVPGAGIAMELDGQGVEVQLGLEQGQVVLTDEVVDLGEVPQVGRAGAAEVDVLGAVEDR